MAGVGMTPSDFRIVWLAPEQYAVWERGADDAGRPTWKRGLTQQEYTREALGDLTEQIRQANREASGIMYIARVTTWKPYTTRHDKTRELEESKILGVFDSLQLAQLTVHMQYHASATDEGWEWDDDPTAQEWGIFYGAEHEVMVTIAAFRLNGRRVDRRVRTHERR